VIVAEYIVGSEGIDAIAEALLYILSFYFVCVIKGWNPSWNPPYFIADYSDAEIGAQGSFPDT